MRSNVLFFAVFILLASACGSGDKKESEEGKDGATDFVINGKNIELAEKFKYDEEEAKADPNKSYYAKVGEEIVFKAVLGKDDKITEWICPTQNSGEAFSTDDSAKLTFNETGLFEVSLWTEKGEKPVTKYIYVTAGDGSADNVAGVEKIVDVKSTSSNRVDNPPPPPAPSKPAPEKQPVAKVEPPKKVEAAPAAKALLADAKTRDNVEPKKPSPPPPPPPAKSMPAPAPKTTPPPPKAVTPPPAKTEVAKAPPAPEVKKEAAKAVPPPAPVAPVAEERMKAYEKVGANTKTKSEEEGAWVEKTTITLSPQKRCKLTEAYVYPNGSGKVKATLRNNQSGQSASTSSNVNKGKSLITLDELDDITLEPGNTYSLTIEPSSGVKIENAAAQNPAQRESPKLKIDYKGNICVFDLKFKY